MYRCTGVQSLQNRFLLRRKESGLARKVSDAALYGFNKPQDIEEMRPEKEPLVIEDDSIPPGDGTMQDFLTFWLRRKLKGPPPRGFSLSVSVCLSVYQCPVQNKFRAF